MLPVINRATATPPARADLNHEELTIIFKFFILVFLINITILALLTVQLLKQPRYVGSLYLLPHSILIDDLKVTIDEWNAGGGIGILHTSAASTIKQLKELGL